MAGASVCLPSFQATLGGWGEVSSQCVPTSFLGIESFLLPTSSLAEYCSFISNLFYIDKHDDVCGCMYFTCALNADSISKCGCIASDNNTIISTLREGLIVPPSSPSPLPPPPLTHTGEAV